MLRLLGGSWMGVEDELHRGLGGVQVESHVDRQHSTTLSINIIVLVIPTRTIIPDWGQRLQQSYLLHILLCLCGVLRELQAHRLLDPLDGRLVQRRCSIISFEALQQRLERLREGRHSSCWCGLLAR